jgi:hypothetical protein
MLAARKSWPGRMEQGDQNPAHFLSEFPVPSDASVGRGHGCAELERIRG